MTPDVLGLAAAAAERAYHRAHLQHTAEQLAEVVADGADGTAVMRIDQLVEDAVLEAVAPTGVNVLTEERGWFDHGSSVTLVMDPVDGTANAAAGVPLSAFSAAIVTDGDFVDALTLWLATGMRWRAASGGGPARSTTGRTGLAGATVAMVRPKPATATTWNRIASLAARVRVLGSSCLEAALVADGSIDAFCDPGSDTHRIVDLAAAVVLLAGSGGTIIDAFGRPIEFDLDLHRRWSGIAAATPALAEELAQQIAAGDSSDPHRAPEAEPPQPSA